MERPAVLVSSMPRSRAVVAVSLLSGFALLLGYARDAGLAAGFGPGATTDAFFAASLVPIMLGRVILAGALVPAILPVFAGLWPRPVAWTVANTILTVGGLGLAALSAMLVVAAGPLFRVIAPGFDPVRQELAVRFLWLMGPLLLFLGLAAALGALLNALDSFALPALGQVLVNGTSFLAVLLSAGSGSLEILALGVLGGGILQFIALILALRGRGWRYHWTLALDHPAVRDIGALLMPLLAFMIVDQTVTLTERLLASTWAMGDLSRLSLANKIYQIPIVALAGAVALVLFPALAREQDPVHTLSFAATLAAGLRQMLFLTAPLALWFLAGSEAWVRLAFQHGAFGSADTAVTADLLRGYSLAVAPTGVLLLLNRAFYARRDTQTPLWIAVGVAAGYIVLALFLSRRLGLIGLPLAFALSQTGGALVSALALARRSVIASRMFLDSAGRGLCVSVVGLGAALCLWPFLIEPQVRVWPVPAQNLTLLAAVAGSAMVYLWAAARLGVPEARHYVALLVPRKAGEQG